jgi:uncharacterized protein with von Willebrand factor type A (vWA) domain
MSDRDVATIAATFGRAVHDAGIACTPERSVRFARALSLAPPATRDRLYWTARAIFVSTREEIEAFDRVFARLFDGLVDPADARGDANSPPVPGAEPGPRPAPARTVPGEAPPVGGGSPASGLREQDDGADSDGRPRLLPVAAASAQERLAEKDFAELDEQELIALRRLMRALTFATPPRRTRRAHRDRHGERLDLRATLRASCRTAGDPARQLRRRRQLRARRLVVLCDISGSMEPYARAFLQFLHGAVGAADAEAFVFATRLTRLTRALKGADPDLAITRAAALAPDWSSGTRIGEALRCFNDRHGRRGMAHGAVVVVLSDGWERGDPALVAREMERLSRLAYRIIWVNPRKAGRDFAPVAAGMAAALPYCDALVSGHSLSAMSSVVQEIGARR